MLQNIPVITESTDNNKQNVDYAYDVNQSGVSVNIIR